MTSCFSKRGRGGKLGSDEQEPELSTDREVGEEQALR